ncbi:MAG: hypothetical protein ACJ8GN_18855 [Longimicrobiaceae bacterium]
MKIRERKETRFEPGALAGVLLLIVTVLMPLAGSGFVLSWVSRQVQANGLGSPNQFESMLIVAVPTLAIGVGAVVAAFRHKRALQPLRDSEAALEGPYALFLRAYYSDYHSVFPNPFLSASSGGVFRDSVVLGPEEFVARVLEPFIDVREVGGSPSTIGSARITTADEEWQPAVVKAIHGASVIVVLPLMKQDRKGATRGEAMIWELRYLVESGLMDRTIVLMPGVPWVVRWKMREAWERSRLRVAGFGLELPQYDGRGGIWAFVRSGQTWRPEKSFAPVASSQKRLAAGLVEALLWMSGRFEFPLLDR